MNKKTIIIVVLIALVLFFILKKFVVKKKGIIPRPINQIIEETKPVAPFNNAILVEETTETRQGQNVQPVSPTAVIPAQVLDKISTIKFDDNGNPIEGDTLFYVNLNTFGLYGFDVSSDIRHENVSLGRKNVRIINPSKLTGAEKLIFNFSKKLVDENKFSNFITADQLTALKLKNYI